MVWFCKYFVAEKKICMYFFHIFLTALSSSSAWDKRQYLLHCLCQWRWIPRLLHLDFHPVPFACLCICLFICLCEWNFVGWLVVERQRGTDSLLTPTGQREVWRWVWFNFGEYPTCGIFTSWQFMYASYWVVFSLCVKCQGNIKKASSKLQAFAGQIPELAELDQEKGSTEKLQVE